MNRDGWCTPKKLWKVVQAYRPIDLDPCSNSRSTVPAKTRVQLPNTEVQFESSAGYELVIGDGLALGWAGHVWLNPPYSNIAPWLEKASQQKCSQQPYEVEVSCVLPARATVFRCPQPDAVLFLPFRFHFEPPPGVVASSPAENQLLAYYGTNALDWAVEMERAFGGWAWGYRT